MIPRHMEDVSDGVEGVKSLACVCALCGVNCCGGVLPLQQHLRDTCTGVFISCPEGCGQEVMRRKVGVYHNG